MAPADLRERLIVLLGDRLLAAPDTVLRIGGAGCVGKSTLAIDLAARLAAAGLDAVILDLDCYLTARLDRERAVPPISPYDPRSYDLGAALADIWALRAGGVATVQRYDKRTGRRQAAAPIGPGGALIVEGSMALHARLGGDWGLRLYLDAPDAVLLANRIARERGYGATAAATGEKFAFLRPDYEAHILSQRDAADIRALIGDAHRVIGLSGADDASAPSIAATDSAPPDRFGWWWRRRPPRPWRG